MKIIIEFKDINEYLEFKEKTAHEVNFLEQLERIKSEEKVIK